jgi:tRNA1(Val) A37 N6-methylase TrmN6
VIKVKKPLFFARELVTAVLKHGSYAVDATCGNGRDTVFLADLVGETGRVLALDIQHEAIIKTEKRLADAGFSHRVTLVRADHAHLDQYLEGPVDAVMFNLGYLPGGDHNTVTRPETTLPALRAAVAALAKGGVVTVVVYTGHAGGTQEYAVLQTIFKISAAAGIHCAGILVLSIR